MKALPKLIFCLILALMMTMAIAACDDDDDDDNDDATPVDDDTVDDDDDDTGDDDDDDTGDDDDDTGDDDTGDDDTGDDDTPETTPGFAYIPPGTFTMGSPEEELGHRPDETQHDVTLSYGFEMMKAEVTQGQWKELMKYNPSNFVFFGSSEDLPVESVSWYDALAFANELSKEKGYTPCYTLTDIICTDETPGNTFNYCKNNGGIFTADVALNGLDDIYECEGFRLPTESEWEYAARAGTTTAFYTGEINEIACKPLDENLADVAWYCGNAEMLTRMVKQKQPNDWDLYDMYGNVREWCWDWYAKEYPGDVTDPTGPADGHFKVTRGGAYRFDGAVRLRSAYRTGHAPSYHIYLVGFRLVRTLPEEKTTFAYDFTAPIQPVLETPVVQRDLPDELPFEFTRPAVGTPLTPQEIEDFTDKMAGFLADTYFFERLYWISHGMDATSGYPDYKLYWQDTTAVKADDTVTFTHVGGADNLMIRTSKYLNNAAAGYLATGDEMFGRLVEQYSKGIVALFDGMVWTENDPEEYLMARALFTVNHSYTEEGGRNVVVDYEPYKTERYDWNAHTLPNVDNPYWGDGTWLRTMRSKDDVPHIFRMVPLLMRVVEDGADPDVRDAAQDALEHLQLFARDIVDTGYMIRAKDKYGNQFIPLNEYGFINDLCSFVLYDPLAPLAECNGELNSALIGYDDPLNIHCLNGIGRLYEIIAVYGHYFNAAIIRYFHIAAAHNALIRAENDIAYSMLEGLTTRSDEIMNDENGPVQYSDWWPDYAGFLLAAATVGLPLTDEEARVVMEQYTASVDHYMPFQYWDPWDASAPNGTFRYEPTRDGSGYKVVRFPEMSFIVEYCYSPFRNPDGAELVDCDVILDPTQWK